MTGKLLIEATGTGMHLEGDMSFRGKREIYELICIIAETYDVDSVDEWAALTVHFAGRTPNRNRTGTSTKTEIRIPNIKKEGERP